MTLHMQNTLGHASETTAFRQGKDMDVSEMHLSAAFDPRS